MNDGMQSNFRLPILGVPTMNSIYKCIVEYRRRGSRFNVRQCVGVLPPCFPILQRQCFAYRTDTITTKPTLLECNERLPRSNGSTRHHLLSVVHTDHSGAPVQFCFRVNYF